MAYITQRAFMYIPKKALRLAGEEWTRRLNVYAGWSKIRIGLLCAVTPDGVNNLYSAGFFCGLFSGDDSGSAYAGSCVGVSLVANIGASSAKLLTYNAGSGYPYFSTPTTGNAFRKVNGTIISESAASSTSQSLAIAGAYQQRKTPIIVEISRPVSGVGTFTFTVYSTNTATAQYQPDYRADHLMDGMDVPVVPIVYGQTMTSILSTTLVASDFINPLDSIFLFWQRTKFPLEVYAVGAVVFIPTTWGVQAGGKAAADETFEAYNAGTVTPSIVKSGTNWTSYGTVIGNSNLGAIVGWAGTTTAVSDTFESYGTSFVYGTTVAAGSFWTSYGTMFGISLLYPIIGQVGTSGGPYDSFDTYVLGTVMDAGTLNAGMGWVGSVSLV